jgi:hypothetical protein
MAHRLLLLSSFALSLACQPPAPPPASAETLPPFDDDAAFSVSFPSSTSTADAAVSTEPFDTPVADDAAAPGPAPDAAAPGPAPDASQGAPSGDDDPTDAMANAEPEGACDAPLSPGDIIIDEIMVESVAGTGDYGEWIEARSTLSCQVNLLGLHGECPKGAKVITFDVTSDFWVIGGASFLIADSMVPAINHYLPEPLFTWGGHQGDVLRNEGATVSLRMNDVLIDSVTYPALKLLVGRSWAFPSDCDPTLRSDFANWQTSTSSWFPSFFGTPNEPNDDVHCP